MQEKNTSSPVKSKLVLDSSISIFYLLPAGVHEIFPPLDSGGTICRKKKRSSFLMVAGLPLAVTSKQVLHGCRINRCTARNFRRKEGSILK